MAIIKPNNNTISAITALPAAISTGKVLQVVQTASGSTNMVNVSGYVGSGLSITPTSSSSKILITLSGRTERYSGSSSDYNILNLHRGTTDLYTITDAQLYQLGNSVRQFFAVNYLDTPNTTSSTQYRIYSNEQGSGSVTFYQHFTLTEVAG